MQFKILGERDNGVGRIKQWEDGKKQKEIEIDSSRRGF